MRTSRIGLLAVLAIAFAVTGCSRLFSTGPSSSDAISYEVTGTGTVGLTALTFASPTAGAQQATANLNLGAFESAVFTGWGQNAGADPSITATATGAGSALACVTVRIMKNGAEVKAQHGCGSPTVTVTAK